MNYNKIASKLIIMFLLSNGKAKSDLEQHFATPHFTSIVPVLVNSCEQAPVVQTFQKSANNDRTLIKYIFNYEPDLNQAHFL